VKDLRKSLNHYLLYEFAMDLDEDDSKVSDTWPFELREIGLLVVSSPFRSDWFLGSVDDYFFMRDEHFACDTR
jgi:hypothetical protein